METSASDKVLIKVQNVIKVGNTEIFEPVFNIYPNPATGIITLEFNQNQKKVAKILVLNMAGVEIFRKELINVDNYKLDLSNQVSGIYILKVNFGNREYNSKIVLKKQ